MSQRNKNNLNKRWAIAILFIKCIAAVLFLIINTLAAQNVRLASVKTIIPVVTQTSDETVSATSATPTPAATPTDAVSPKETDTPEVPVSTGKAAESPAPTKTPSPTVKEEQPPLLEKMIKKYSVFDISASQLIMLAYRSGGSSLYLYDKNSVGIWTLYDSFPANVGKNGITDSKTEGDKKTPTGLYGIGYAFGNGDTPDTKWKYRKVTPDSYWVDDPKSINYNKWVEGTNNKDWNSAEHLSDETTAYAYALVIEYNTDPTVPGKGSAIFLHCGSNTTVGCVSTDRSNVLKILKWLYPKSGAHILIADAR